jgi:hypothetical protein
MDKILSRKDAKSQRKATCKYGKGLNVSFAAFAASRETTIPVFPG